MIRHDVFKLAADLAAQAEMAPAVVYDFLMQAGKAAGVNPRKMQWATLPGVVYKTGDFESCHIERFAPAEAAPIAAGIDFEDLILARQEKYMD